jgi:hypothetical protein
VSARYGTEDAALRRAETLRQRGTWPGVIRCADGLFRLTYDPQDTTEDE